MTAYNHRRRLQHYIAPGIFILLVALAAIIGSVGSGTAFYICFGLLLLTLCVVQLKLAVDLYTQRNNLQLQLFQPQSLSLLATAGAIATIASFLFAFPEYDATCALRQPIILTSITFMGNLLIGRAWRIGTIISSTATFATAGSDIDKLGAARMKVMNVLSTLSQLGRYVCSGGREKMGRNSGIRRAITFADSMFVVMVLLIPQLVLQIVNLSVPSVRMGSEQKMIKEEAHFTCKSEAAPYVLVVGIVLALIPFAISLLINIQSKSIPDKFRELEEIAASMTSSFWMLFGTLPAAGMIGQTQPNAFAYLLAASVLSFVLPLSYNISQTRLQNATKSTSLSGRNANSKRSPIPRSSNPRQMLRTSSNLSTSSRDGKVEDDPLILNAADETAVMCEMFGAMGSTSKAVDMKRDILTLFKVGDEEFAWESGFTMSEIYSLGPKSLVTVVKTLLGSSKLWHGIFQLDSNDEEAGRRGIKCCIDALTVFDKAPAKRQLRDRSFIFPCYSFMNVISKTMTYIPPNNMSKEEFEMTLAENFVKETHFQHYHHCHALAFQADIMKRQGKYEEAIPVINEMKTTYNPRVHSRILVKEYITDNCINIIAVSTCWMQHFGRSDEALQVCDEVINSMLPEIEATELLSKLQLLFPVCLTMASQGQQSTAKRALELFRTHVSDPAVLAGSKAHPGLGGRVPIMIILKCRSVEGGEAYVDLKSDIAYMLNRNDPEWFEVTYLSYFDVTWSTVCAEACLHLARITSCTSQEASKYELIKEGLKCLGVSANTLTNKDGAIVNSMAHSYYSRILSELENLNAIV